MATVGDGVSRLEGRGVSLAGHGRHPLTKPLKFGWSDSLGKTLANPLV